ncbi:MAG TPA: transcriptional regulator, partial [Vicinamibacteria bacterium]|nr:transcriptional regulator [Vicinamibacteria bacterium]
MASPAGPPSSSGRRRYRFASFTLSPRHRKLVRDGREVPLIPRYLDLLILLVHRRHEAVPRRDILDGVWSDVVVSDGALTQAVRSLRRALGDPSREPVFIRTVSRHGYQFIFPGVSEEVDEGPLDEPASLVSPSQTGTASVAEAGATSSDLDPFEAALARLLVTEPVAAGEDGDAARREAAEALHALGTAEALRRLDLRPGHESARALLRDARWDVPGAGPVPLLGQPGGLSAARILVHLRLRRALRLAGRRWTAASGGGAAAGLVGGGLGGLALVLAPGSSAPARAIVPLALVGAIVGGLGAAGVGAGLAMAEALARSLRGLALVLLGAAGGAAVGFSVHLLGRWSSSALLGQDLWMVGGGLEGLGLGAAAGLGYGLAAPRPGGGMAAPRGGERIRAALVAGACCAAAAVALTVAGRTLAGASLNAMARAFQGSQVGLAPLARLLGEPELGPVTRAVLAAYEGLLF